MDPLPIVVPPIEDEGLGSWLARIAQSYNVSVVDLLSFCGIAPSDRGRRWLDLPALKAEDLFRLARFTRTSVAKLKAMNLEWALAFRSCEQGFCSGCLSADRSASRPLYWRASWLGAFSTHCLAHGRALAVLSADGVDAFSYARHWGFIDAGRLTYELGERPVERDALQLQQAFAHAYPQEERERQYGLSSADDLRIVTGDLANILLRVEDDRRPRCLLLRIACLDPRLHRVVQLLRVPLGARAC